MDTGSEDSDLWRQLYADSVSQLELQYALQRHFSQSWLDPNDDVRYVGRNPDGGGFALRLVYKRDTLVRMEAGPELSREDVDVIRQWIEEHILHDHGVRVVRRICFSLQPVTGAWRYRDRVQILPAPATFPRSILVTAPQPLIAEMPFPYSSDLIIWQLRQSFGWWEMSLLLSTFLDGHIEVPNNQSRNHWVVCYHHHGFSTQYTREDYLAPDFIPEQDAFSSLTGFPLMARVEPEEYFTRSTLGPPPLDLPSSLETLLDMYFALTLDQRDQFLRACYWLNHAYAVFTYSQSASYLAVIQAIETLLPPGEEDKCPTCGRNRSPGPTARFQRFLDAYAPSAATPDPVRRELYRLRSNLTHGSILLHADIGPGSAWAGPSPAHWQQYSNALAARQLARIALVNWLSKDSPQVPRVAPHNRLPLTQIHFCSEQT